MKKLIVSGDSNTDLNFRSSFHPDWDFSWKKWPEHLAESLGMELVCLGRMGVGNQYIYHSLLEEIINTDDKGEIGLVVAGWTQAMRKDWQVNDTWKSSRVDQDGDLLGWVNKSLRHYLSFQLLCDKWNIPYFHFQMIDFFEAYLNGLPPSREEGWGEDYFQPYPGDKEKDTEKILNRIVSFDNYIDNFIGWPGLRKDYESQGGGFNMLENVFGYTLNNQISKFDDHPNEKGHKAIADFLVEELRQHPTLYYHLLKFKNF